MTVGRRLATYVLTVVSCAVAVSLFPETLVAQAAPPQAQAAAAEPSGLTDARRLFDAMDYDEAVQVLDVVIRVLDAVRDRVARERLASAYELRARTLLNLGRRDAAAVDFRALLTLDPPHELPPGLSPKVRALFEEIRKATVGQVALDITPRDAAVAIDGESLAAATVSLYLASGQHRISASRPAHRATEQTFFVSPGVEQTLTLALERVSASATIVTIPPGVEVFLDERAMGATEPAAAPPPDAWLAKYNAPATEFSRPFLFSNLAVGTHKVRLRRECYRPVTVELAITRLDDFTYLPVQLEPAQGAVQVSVEGEDAQVFLDGVSKGTAPLRLGSVCEGTHTIEVRTPDARLFRRLNVNPGDELKVEGAVRPALAVVSTSSALARRRGATDPRLELERLFERAETVALFAAPDDVVRQFLQVEKLDAEWLAFDRLGKPVTRSASEVNEAERMQLSGSLARRLGAQGIVALSAAPGGEPNDLLLTVLAAGSARPDVIPVRLGDPQSARAVLARLDRAVPSFKRSLGLLAIDVLDGRGPVVAGIEEGGAAALANVKLGDTIVAAEGRPIESAGDLESVVQGLRAERSAVLDVLDRAGGRTRVSIAARLMPRLIAPTDRTQLFNKNVVDLRYQLVSATPEQAPFLRLNLANCLIGIRAWEEARRELDALLSASRAIDAGTINYFLGLCYDALHMPAEAERAWRAALTALGQLYDDGPPVRELAEARLRAMQGQR